MSVVAHNSVSRSVGSVGALRRYPVKSMLGEELNASTIGRRGLLGDGDYAIVDPQTGTLASAKTRRSGLTSSVAARQSSGRLGWTANSRR